MSEYIEKDGFLFNIYDDYAMVGLTQLFEEDEVFFPSEIDGVPVTVLVFNPSRARRKIKRMVLPESIKEVIYDESAYHDSVVFEISPDNPYIFTDGKAVYTKDSMELMLFVARGDEEYTILDGCKRIGKKAFEFASDLTRVNFPKGLETICVGAFEKCAELAELHLPEGLVKIETNAFRRCGKIRKLTLPSTLEYIGTWAFDEGENALTVHFPPALKKMGRGAFPTNWTFLLSENQKTYISRGGFILSNDGKTLVLPEKPLENGIAVIPDSVTEIGRAAFWRNQQIEKVILPKGLHTIGPAAFFHVSCLKEINLENVKVIRANAFHGCSSLERISLKCEMIGISAFSNCASLTEAEVDCEIISAYTFYSCESLSKMVMKNTKLLGAGAFCNTRKLKKLAFPPELEVIEDLALAGNGTDKLIVPKTVKRLGKEFAGGIKEIHIFDNIELDIRPDNDVSKENYTLYVHSAQTGEIKYAVPVIGGEFGTGFGQDEHDNIVSMFSGLSFDYEAYDKHFCSISVNYLMDKFNSALIRLKYGCKPDEQTLRSYGEQLGELGQFIAEHYISENKPELILDPVLYTYVSAEDLLRLVDASAGKHWTELTALLMQMCNEKNSGKLS